MLFIKPFIILGLRNLSFPNQNNDWILLQIGLNAYRFGIINPANSLFFVSWEGWSSMGFQFWFSSHPATTINLYC